MSSPTRIAVVTGANKGIGYAIVRNLALEYPRSAFNNGPLLIYLTARSKERGEEAVQKILQDEQLKRAAALGQGQTDVKYYQLDIADKESVAGFGRYLEKEHPEGIDIVVNNAGVALSGFDTKVVEETLAINYYGTLSATQTLLPLIRPGGRLVNVSSMSGSLSKYSSTLQSAFRNAQTSQDVTALMQAFVSAVAKGTHASDGWPSSAYAVSKAGVTGMTLAVAAEQERKHRTEGGGGKGGDADRVLINACCPGYVATDMTKGGGVKTIDQGAKTPVMLALADIGGVTGAFWKDERLTKW